MPATESRYAPWSAYGQSKLAKYHFALGLEQQFRLAGVRAISLMAHPGLSTWLTQKYTALTGMKPSKGVLPQLRAATDPAAQAELLCWVSFARAGTREMIRPARLTRSDTTSIEFSAVHAVRERPAMHYLRRTTMSNTEIALLLGYDEPSSFHRAFHGWTGQTAGQRRLEMVSRRGAANP